MVVDDYGHHPTEIAAVIAAARAGIDRRVVVVFQPHRYTRTEQLMPEFGTRFGGADEIVLTDIYPAGEPPIPGVTIEALAEPSAAARRIACAVVKRLDELPAAVAALARRGDLVITLGAGSIGTSASGFSRRSASTAAARRGAARSEREGAGREELPPRAGRSPESASRALLVLVAHRCECACSMLLVLYAALPRDLPGR